MYTPWPVSSHMQYTAIYAYTGCRRSAAGRSFCQNRSNCSESLCGANALIECQYVGGGEGMEWENV